MNDTVWLALAYSRLAIRSEMLEQENAVLRLEVEKMKGLREVKQPEEKEDANAT